MREWSHSITCPMWPKARCPGRPPVPTGCDVRGVAMRQGGRHWNRLLVAASWLLGACYVYAPVTTPEPQPGARLAFDLNDQGRQALVTSVGPAAARVEGAFVSDAAGEYVI